MNPPTEAPPNGQKEKMVIGSACVAVFMATLDTSIVNVSLPEISRSFHMDTVGAVGIIQYYQLFLAATMLVCGKVADQFRLKSLFIGGFGLFTLSSILCAAAPTAAWLVVGRSIQGIGGSLLTITSYTLVPKHVPRENRGKSYGWITTSAAFGLTIGAPLGGFLTGSLSWPWIFWINIPIGLAAMFFAGTCLPSEPGQRGSLRSSARLDLWGAALSFLSVWFFLYAIGPGRKNGFFSLSVFFTLLAAGTLFVWFVLRLKKVPHPIVDPQLLRVAPFILSVTSAVSAFLFLAGSNFLYPFFLELVKKLSPAQSGLTLTVYSVVYMCISPLAGRLADTIGPVRTCRIGMSSASLACLFFVLTVPQAGIWPVFVFLAWLAASFGFFIAPNNHLLLSQAQEGNQGSAAGLYGLLTRLGMLMGVGVMEALFSSIAGRQSDVLPALSAAPPAVLHGFQAVGIGGILLCAFSAFLMFRIPAST